LQEGYKPKETRIGDRIMLIIEGSYGEGGGQILRMAIALSAVTKIPIKIRNKRAKRRVPGLRPQHLAAIRTVKDLTNAKVKGLELGSSELSFTPEEIQGGELKFNIGTAGSITLVLQACCLSALFAKERTCLRIKGGTDVPYSLPWDYFVHTFLSLLSKMGVKILSNILRRGYFPKGGGEVRVEIKPIKTLKPLWMAEAGEFDYGGIANISNSLPLQIAERIKKAASQIIFEREKKASRIEIESNETFSPGCGIVLWAESKETCLGSSALGKKGLPAERVGSLASEELLKETEAKATLDVHAFDQLLPYMAFATRGGPSKVLVREQSQHAKTIQWLIKKFTDVDFLTEKVNSLWGVTIK
jgi:RNA 3'-phosphate cyclase